jgi:hypothetical protein
MSIGDLKSGRHLDIRRPSVEQLEQLEQSANRMNIFNYLL